MKRVLLVGQVLLDDDSSGVTQKVLAQARAFAKMGASVECIGYAEGHIIVYEYDPGLGFDAKRQQVLCATKSERLRRFALWSNVQKYVQGKLYNLAYIRYPIIDRVVLRALHMIRESCDYVVMEIPSYPLQRTPSSFVQKLQFGVDEFLRDSCSRYIDKVLYIGNTVDAIFGCRAEQIPNGLPDGIEGVQGVGYCFDGNRINLVGVSNMYTIHGYDRLIESLATYYEKGDPKYEVHITLIGDGPYRNSYERCVNAHNLNDHVRFTGMLKCADLDREYSCATVGIGSLALFREGFFEASSLKTKEYLMRGIPFVYAVEEIGIDDSFPFALKVPNCDEPIEMSQIISFVIEFSQKQPLEICDVMRSYAYEHFSWFNILKKACGGYLE